jgi:hypothetical protein
MLDLFPDTAPFVSGSSASWAAAAALSPEALRGDRAMVYELIKEAGDQGCTDDEIEVLTQGRAHQSMSPRRNELVRQGLVCNSGRQRITRNGQMATVWVLGLGVALRGAPNHRAVRPKDEEIREAEAEIGRLVDESGFPESLALGKLRAWLRDVTTHASGRQVRRARGASQVAKGGDFESLLAYIETSVKGEL